MNTLVKSYQMLGLRDCYALPEDIDASEQKGYVPCILTLRCTPPSDTSHQGTELMNNLPPGSAGDSYLVLQGGHVPTDAFQEVYRMLMRKRSAHGTRRDISKSIDEAIVPDGYNWRVVQRIPTHGTNHDEPFIAARKDVRKAEQQVYCAQATDARITFTGQLDRDYHISELRDATPALLEQALLAADGKPFAWWTHPLRID